MKKSCVLLTTIVSALTLSGCCFFMSPPPEPVKPAPTVAEPVMAAPAPTPVVVVTPAPVPTPEPLPPADSDKDGVIDENDLCPGTAIGVAVDSRGCTIATEEKIRITIGVLFATNKAEIKEDSTEDIKKLGVFMQTYPNTTTVVEGHTDNVGSATLNKDLSLRRAEAVREYLIKNYNIEPNRIKAVGYGSERPVADNATAAGRKMNRRTEAAIETIVLKAQ